MCENTGRHRSRYHKFHVAIRNAFKKLSLQHPYQQLVISLAVSRLKPCPHCRRKVRLSPKTATVAENGDCRRKRRLYRRKVRLSQKSASVAENGETTATVAEFGGSRTFLRQSPFSATAAVFSDKLSPKSATTVASRGQALTDHEQSSTNGDTSFHCFIIIHHVRKEESRVFYVQLKQM